MRADCRPSRRSQEFSKTPAASAACVVDLGEHLRARRASLVTIYGPTLDLGADAIEAAFTRAIGLLFECAEDELDPILVDHLVGKLERLADAYTDLRKSATRAMKP